MSGVSLTVSSTAICTHAEERERIRNIFSTRWKNIETNVKTSVETNIDTVLTEERDKICKISLQRKHLMQIQKEIAKYRERIWNIFSRKENIWCKYKFKFGPFCKASGFCSGAEDLRLRPNNFKQSSKVTSCCWDSAEWGYPIYLENNTILMKIWNKTIIVIV